MAEIEKNGILIFSKSSQGVILRNFVDPTNRILNTLAEEIPPSEIPSKWVQEIIDEMLFIASDLRSNPKKGGLVGLAAPQIGIPKRVILVDVEVDSSRKNFGKFNVYINPKILSYSKEEEIGREGCLSTGCIYGLVPRSKEVRISAFNRMGKEVIEEHRGFTARILQHEIDHLDGTRFPDRLGEKGELHYVEENERQEYRENWQHWKKKFPWEGWINIKKG